MLSVSFVLSVEGAMECEMRVNDVICAVSLSGTMRRYHLCATRKICLGDLIDAHALGCHLFNCKKVPLRSGPFSM